MVIAPALVGLLAVAACAGGSPHLSGPPDSPPTVPAPTTVAPTEPPGATGGGGGSTAPGPPATTTAPNLGAVQLKLTPVAKLREPIALAIRAGDPALYVAERGGRILAIRNGALDPAPVLDMQALTRAGGERGLLGIAFSPDGRFLYTSYTDVNGNSNVDEYTVAATGAIDPASRRLVLFVTQPFPNHNGGNIVFGPDGLLYLGFGDGGSEGDPQGNGQKMSTLLGKMLRIDPRPHGNSPYAVPADNPFIGQAGARPEIWAVGVRNPWRFQFDPATGDLWIGDVGQNEIEEIDWLPAAARTGRGVNLGWSNFEGSAAYHGQVDRKGYTFPVFEYHHDQGCAVTGGFRYRGSAIPALRGAYVFSDYCASWIRAITVADGKTTGDRRFDLGLANVISFGQDQAGELYALSLGGTVARLDPA